MKLFIATAAATLIATASFAGQSTRYEDLRLDTSLTADVVHAADAGETRPNERAADLRLETFSDESAPVATFSTSGPVSSLGEGFAYGGYGAGNDSR
ncbi:MULTISPECIES: hypothetical protein [Sulfitobacter]|uniref:hypothetical protein n=1 Tax=Sulfitobacter TaxID=60136 RepID=UPI0007C234AC|nr:MULTISPECIES: hypothetical protein [Sulfitobacter]KZY50735.1 hypothetical protein A3734_00795 [Sulfitobacter sp. HI0054]MBO9437551.1 hypothetical protein [Sulfitobacter sp. R18_2]MDF3417266.1 hypothetical protein [Sulfitobacter sp. Ks38]MDF3424748.1 hypothetical protein [Sulfitobacter sp. KE29]MDF3428328.1 hypothetical protein [Sulfitobacter sp. S46]